MSANIQAYLEYQKIKPEPNNDLVPAIEFSDLQSC